MVSENYKLLESNLTLKDSIIYNKNHIIDIHEEKELGYKEMLLLKDKQIAEYVELTDRLKKEVNRYKKRASFGLSATLASVLFVVGTIIK